MTGRSSWNLSPNLADVNLITIIWSQLLIIKVKWILLKGDTPCNAQNREASASFTHSYPMSAECLSPLKHCIIIRASAGGEMLLLWPWPSLKQSVIVLGHRYYTLIFRSVWSTGMLFLFSSISLFTPLSAPSLLSHPKKIPYLSRTVPRIFD